MPRVSRGKRRCLREVAHLSRVGVSNTSPPTAGRAPGASRSCLALSLKLLTPSILLLTLLLAMTLAGCARYLDRPTRAAPSQSRAAPSQSRTCQPAELASEPPPDCEFRASDLKTVDPEQFARLKVAYERQCYRRAAQAERERLRQLRASKGC